MANKNQTVVIRGKAMYAKVLGDPVPNYSKDGYEWKLDVVIDENTVKEIKKLGIGDRVKQKDTYADGKPYLSFKQKQFTSTGKANDPIEVVDINGRPWDQKSLIGNLSTIDLRFAVVDYGPGKKSGVYPRKIRVLDLVPYGGSDFEPISEDDEFFQKAVASKAAEETEFRKDFGLDDDVSDIAEDEDIAL